MRYSTSYVCILIVALAAIVRSAESATAPATASATHDSAAIDYFTAAHAVMKFIQDDFYLPSKGLYAHSLKNRAPDFMWGDGVLFSALVGAARNDPAAYRVPMNRFFSQLDRYWDKNEKIPGYEPTETNGSGNDKYYDDNAWMVLTFTEAYALTNDRAYLQRAEQTLAFVLSGEDDQLGGGIWWHERHKENSKNTCANAPAIVGCLRVARFAPNKSAPLFETAQRLTEWTTKTFRDEDGLFKDSINVSTGRMNAGKLTYNTALMIRADLALYRATGNADYLQQAERSAAAAEWFVDTKTHAYRDSLKWSHLLVEADLEMYRATHDPQLLQRAKETVEYAWRQWQTDPPQTLIDNAALARMLWVFADLQSDSGQAFWRKMDEAASSPASQPSRRK